MSGAALLAGAAGAALAAGLADAAAVLHARRGAGAGAAEARPLRWLAALARLGRPLGAPAAPVRLAAALAAAGMPARVGPGDLMAAKAGSALLAAVAVLPLATAAPARGGVVTAGLAAAGGFAAPDLWLARRARRRAAAAALELADVLDLLRVAVGAGLTTGRALAEVGRRRHGLVAAELRALATRLELGVPRAAALAHLRARLPLPGVAALAATLERGERHGAPLGPSLAALAADARAGRARALQERAAAAAPRIQLVVALLLVPAVLLLVAAGLVHALA